MADEDTLRKLEERLTRLEAAMGQQQPTGSGGFTPPGGAVVDPAPFPGYGRWGHYRWPHPVVDPGPWPQPVVDPLPWWPQPVVDPAPRPPFQTAGAATAFGLALSPILRPPTSAGSAFPSSRPPCIRSIRRRRA
jgi:hypothetical protein